MTITNTTCHAWTHHTAGGTRVECVAHGVVFDGTADEAKAARLEHEGASSALEPAQGR